jgi:hypothetical protein
MIYRKHKRLFCSLQSSHSSAERHVAPVVQLCLLRRDAYVVHVGPRRIPGATRHHTAEDGLLGDVPLGVLVPGQLLAAVVAAAATRHSVA